MLFLFKYQNMLEFITENLWFIVPTYATTFLLFFGVLLVKYLSKFTGVIKPLLTHIDFGINFYDRKPLIGEDKPIAGWIMPFIAAVGSYFLFSNLFLMLLISYFSFFGDLAGSFLKRRLGITEHKPLIIVDQLSFILVAYAAAFSFGMRISINDLLMLLILTFAIHFSANLVLFKLKLKTRPY